MDDKMTTYTHSNDHVATCIANSSVVASSMREMMNSSKKRQTTHTVRRHIDNANLEQLAKLDTSASQALPNKRSIVTSDNGELTLEAKRRKLLDKKDWLGLGYQRSLIEGLAPPPSVEKDTQRRKGTPLVIRKPHPTNRGNHQSGALSRVSQKPTSGLYLRRGARELTWDRENGSITSRTSKSGSLSSNWDCSSKVGTAADASPVIPRTPPARFLSPTRRPENEDRQHKHPGVDQHEDGSTQKLRGANLHLPHQSIVSPAPTLHHPQPARSSPLAVINLRSPTPDTPHGMNSREGSLERSAVRENPEYDEWEQWLLVDNDDAFPYKKALPTYTGSLPIEDTNLVSGADVDYVLCTTAQPDCYSANVEANHMQNNTEFLMNDLSSTRQHMSTLTTGEFWLNAMAHGDTGELGNDAFEAAISETGQRLLSSMEPTKSIIAGSPSPIHDTAFANSLEKDELGAPVTPNIAAGVECVDQDWTELAHEQATQHPMPSTKRQATATFFQPRRFVGRLASTVDGVKPSRCQESGRRGRGRPKKQRDVQRPDIRAWPNYADDNIDSASDGASLQGLMT